MAVSPCRYFQVQKVCPIREINSGCNHADKGVRALLQHYCLCEPPPNNSSSGIEATSDPEATQHYEKGQRPPAAFDPCDATSPVSIENHTGFCTSCLGYSTAMKSKIAAFGTPGDSGDFGLGQTDAIPNGVPAWTRYMPGPSPTYRFVRLPPKVSRIGIVACGCCIMSLSGYSTL